MKQNDCFLSPQLFLLFNITLLLTFPLTQHGPLILQFVSGHPDVLTQGVPSMIYLAILGANFIGPKNEYTHLIQGFVSLFLLYHLIHLVF